MHGTSFLVWDVGGQEKLRPLWRSYTRCTDGVIFVVDSCKEERLEEAKLELLKIYKSQGSVHSPVLVFANKQDLPTALDVSTIESLLGMKELGAGATWHIQPTCAITGEGLDEGINKLHELILQKRKQCKGQGPKSVICNSKKAVRKVQRSNSHHF